MLTAQEDQILITDKDHSERGQTFKKSEFSSLNSGYGAYHSHSSKAPMPIYEAAEYVTVEQLHQKSKRLVKRPFQQNILVHKYHHMPIMTLFLMSLALHL